MPLEDNQKETGQVLQLFESDEDGEIVLAEQQLIAGLSQDFSQTELEGKRLGLEDIWSWINHVQQHIHRFKNSEASDRKRGKKEWHQINS